MCTTKEEIRGIVHEEILRAYKSTESSVSGFANELKQLTERFEEHARKVNEHLAMQASLTAVDIGALREVAESYNAMGTLKKMAIGLAAFFIAIGAIVGSMVALLRFMNK